MVSTTSGQNASESISTIRAQLGTLIDQKSQIEAQIAACNERQEDISHLLAQLKTINPSIDHTFSVLQSMLKQRENW